jgi:hypothetical protein
LLILNTAIMAGYIKPVIGYMSEIHQAVVNFGTMVKGFTQDRLAKKDGTSSKVYSVKQ